MKNTIITIGRQYGSGGREIGRQLAEKLDIPFYDKELIAIAAKESGIREDLLKSFDEQATSSFLYSVVMGASALGSRISSVNDMPLNDKLFIIQANIIKEIAQKGSCVIVGRCADYILKENPDCMNVFIHRDMESRAKRAIEEYGEAKEKIESAIAKIDKKRAGYYNYYSGEKWGLCENYHISLDSSIGIENCVTVLAQYINLR